MSETVARHRPSIDLDDFERRLQAQAQRLHHEDDPLAELARIVGEQHDPYGDVFAQTPAAPRHDELRPAFDPHGRREPSLGGERPRLSADFAAIEAGLRGATATGPQAEPAPHYGQPAPDYGYAAEPQLHAGQEARSWSGSGRGQAQRGSRRPVYAMAASIAIAVIGIGVAFAYKGTGSSPREIKTIMAAAGPTKIQPPADASNDQADQDASALGQSATAPTQLVSREEQPVDLSQAVQDNAARNAASHGTDAASVPVPLSPAQAAGTASPDYSAVGGTTPDTSSAGTASPAYGDQGFGVGMPTPKKVKSVSVRPDGTIVSDGAPAAAAPAMDSAPAKSSDRAGPVGGMMTMPDASAAPTTPQTPAPETATRSTRTAAQTADAGTDPAEAPVPKPTKPARKAKPVRVASAETGAQNAADGEEAQPAGAGAFAVQLAAPGSEADARSATSRLLKKYSSALSGRRLGFHRAESNGRTVYRVRVSSLTKEDAVSLCSKLKAGGGTCFVAKN